MIFLHTSDWHIGHTLYNARRHFEFASFLDWLLHFMHEHQVEVLLVAGDVFDTGTPGPYAQKLYYDFLRRVHDTGCRHVVIIAGNHDSPTFLEAPAEILRLLSVHVVGHVRENPADEVIPLRTFDGRLEAVVCAIPFIRDRDVRRQEGGETLQEKELRLVQGITAHVNAVFEAAFHIRQQQKEQYIPVVALAHMYVEESQVALDDDGTRPLYVGTLGAVPASLFPQTLDYVALGHLHRAQEVTSSHIRYSGSVLPMSFTDSQPKSCFLVSIEPQGTNVKKVEIPVFRRLVQVRGTRPEIEAQLHALRHSHTNAFVDIVHTGEDPVSDWRDWIQEILGHETSPVEVLRFGFERHIPLVIKRAQDQETLEELNEHQVFERRMEGVDPPLTPEAREKLRFLYEETLMWIANTQHQPEPEA